jgi:hypothetical protein
MSICSQIRAGFVKQARCPATVPRLSRMRHAGRNFRRNFEQRRARLLRPDGGALQVLVDAIFKELASG